MRNIGYRRVSSVDQNPDRQLANRSLDLVFTDYISGNVTSRPELKRCIQELKQYDVLHVHSIDRLARNLKDLENLLSQLLYRGVAVSFHKEGLYFTDRDSPFQKLQFQIIGAVAEFERSIIRERQREGIRVAQKKGQKFGAPLKLTTKDRVDIVNLKQRGVPISSIARKLNVSRKTIYNYIDKAM